METQKTDLFQESQEGMNSIWWHFGGHLGAHSCPATFEAVPTLESHSHLSLHTDLIAGGPTKVRHPKGLRPVSTDLP